jgi:hypothetical protein
MFKKLVFYKGFAAGVINDYGTNAVHIKLLKDFNIDPTDRRIDEEVVVSESGYYEPLVAEVFEIGDKVERKGGTFKGKVVGFEYSTNSAICVSDKIGKYMDQRTRYSYGVHELSKHDPQLFVFETGAVYRINDCIEAMAVESVFDKHDIMLFSTVNGKMIYRDIKINNCRPELAAKHNITQAVKL